MGSLNELTMDFACKFATEIKAKAILIYGEVAKDIVIKEGDQTNFDIVLIMKEDDEIPENVKRAKKIINIPDEKFTRMSQVKIAVTKGIAAGIFGRGDKIVCVTGIPKFGYFDSVFVFDVGYEFEILTSEDISNILGDIHSEVFEAVLNIALELAAQGREGRPAGTIFVIGDHEKVLQLSRQMVINPFKGYDESERNILDPGLAETIKEFSALDGAFIISDNGTLVAAGRHISAALDAKDFPKGLGSRHIAAAGITSVTEAVSIAVSESTGTVRVFKNGGVLVGIEKAAG